MKKLSLLVFSALLLSANTTFAQYDDVTSDYIPVSNFEGCESLPRTVVEENYGSFSNPQYQNVYVYDLYATSSKAGGYDYASNGWSLQEQKTSANGGVIAYGGEISQNNNKNSYRVKFSWTATGDPIPQSGPIGSTNTKGLCFTGSAVTYQQTEEITLSRGNYKLTVYVYVDNGQGDPKETIGVGRIRTGFMPTGKSGDNDLLPKARSNFNMLSNQWNEDVLEFSITEPTKGRFQLSYGNTYPIIVDHIVLECEGGIVTKDLKAAITKAEALNAELNSADLATAIYNAQAFVAAPTSQDEVATQVQTLQTAMNTALAASTGVINITAAYLENGSFETGKAAPWTVAGGSIEAPVDGLSSPYIDGNLMLNFSQATANSFKQTLNSVPAGFYMLDAKMGGEAKLKVGNVNTACEGGSNPLLIRVYASPQQISAGSLEVGGWANTAFRVDDVRLFYAQDEASLLAKVLTDIKADAQSILTDNNFAVVTGEERDDLVEALKGTDGVAINSCLNAFFKAKDAYERANTAKANAAIYNKENYPYATDATLQQIQTLINTAPATRGEANEQITLLAAACKKVVIENAYCDGIANKADHTSKIAGAKASGSTLNTAWISNNVTICTLEAAKAWTDREGTKNNVVYGTDASYAANNTTNTASITQTISGLPAGKYVLSATMQGKKNVPVAIRINGTKKATYTGTGTILSPDLWSEVVVSFEKTDDADLTIRFAEEAEVTYKFWYFDNLRLYQLDVDNGQVIDGIQNVQTSNIKHQTYFDLSGRRVAQPAKGLYIVNGKKIIK